MNTAFPLDNERIWPLGDGFSGPADPRRLAMLARQAELMNQFARRSNLDADMQPEKKQRRGKTG